MMSKTLFQMSYESFMLVRRPTVKVWLIKLSEGPIHQNGAACWRVTVVHQPVLPYRPIFDVVRA